MGEIVLCRPGAFLRFFTHLINNYRSRLREFYDLKHPAITHYMESVGNPSGRLQTLQSFEAVRDANGRMKFCAGRSAVVFRVAQLSGAGNALLINIHITAAEGATDRKSVV